jgi:hypothetical protein
MNTFARHFPDLAAALLAELEASGRPELAEQLRTSLVRGVSFDADANAGTIALEAGRELNVVEMNIVGVRHGETIAVTSTYDARLDTDNFGRLMGVEILSPPPSLAAALGRGLPSNTSLERTRDR